MIFSFGEFELDTDKVELRRDGSPQPVEPQVFHLLHLLVSNADRLVSRDEIIAKIWNGRFISEAAVASRISMARTALGDDGKRQRYIKTVHRKGLRFLGEVLVDTGSDPQTGTDRANGEAQTDEVPGKESPLPDLQDKPIVAVLPFEGLTGEDKEAIFARGLTEETIALLARFRDIGVYSRSTTSKLTEQGKSISSLRQTLGVDFVVEGSIRLVAEKVKVTVHLIDAATDIHIFSERFEQEANPSALFDIQDQIAILIAGRIADPYGSINRFVGSNDKTKHNVNWDTFYQISRFYDYQVTRDRAVHPSIKRDLLSALEKDANAAVAWAALSLLFVDEYRFHYHEKPRLELLAEALKYANKAVSCDGENSFAHLARALSHYYRREFDDFEIAAGRCISLNPGHAHSLAEIAFCYCLTSNLEKAVPLAERAIQLSPVHPGWFRLTLASDHLMKGNPREAILELKKAPMHGYFWYHAYMLNYCAHAGDAELLKEQLDIIDTLYPDFGTRIFTEAEIWCVTGDMPLKMLEGWHMAGLDVFYPEEYVYLAETHAVNK